MFIDGDSGFGVDDADEAERSRTEEVLIFNGLRIAKPKKDGFWKTLAIESMH